MAKTSDTVLKYLVGGAAVWYGLDLVTSKGNTGDAWTLMQKQLRSVFGGAGLGTDPGDGQADQQLPPGSVPSAAVYQLTLRDIGLQPLTWDHGSIRQTVGGGNVYHYGDVFYASDGVTMYQWVRDDVLVNTKDNKEWHVSSFMAH